MSSEKKCKHCSEDIRGVVDRCEKCGRQDPYEIEQTIKELVQNGNVISAFMKVREITGVGFKEAKIYIDRIVIACKREGYNNQANETNEENESSKSQIDNKENQVNIDIDTTRKDIYG